MATAWRDLLDRQEGVLARSQALGAGMTRHEWAWKLERGLWQRIVPGVAVAHSGGVTDRQRAWAAVLHGGTGAAVSGDAALSLAGLSVVGASGSCAQVDVAIPGGRRAVGGTVDGDPRWSVVIHRVSGVKRWVREVRSLPVVSTHAAVLHAASWADSDRAAEWRLAAAVQRRITAVPLVRKALAEMPALPRHALVGAVLDDVELGAHAGSELQFLRFCRAHGLPLPDELQVRVRVGKVHYLDARYHRQRVTVEVDGVHHKDVETWEKDALRTLRVVAAMPGENVLRLTPGLLRHDAFEVAALLRTILA